MAIYRAGGSSEKVTIDGEKVKERLNLTTTPLFRFLPQHPNPVRDLYGAVYHPVLKTYFTFCLGGDTYKALLPFRNTSDKTFYWESATSVAGNFLGSFVRNNEAYVVTSPGRIFKMSSDGTSYTQVGGQSPTSFITGKAIYLKSKDEIYLFLNSNCNKYNFNNGSWTIVDLGGRSGIENSAIVSKKEKIYRIAFPTNSKNILIFDGTTFTERANALPYANTGAINTLAGVSGDKINIFSGMTIPDENTGRTHFVEGKSISDWVRLYDFSPFIKSVSQDSVCTDTKGIGIALINTRFDGKDGLCVEILNSFMESEA